MTILNRSSPAHDIVSHVGSSGWVQLGNNQVRKELLDLFFTFLLSFFFQDWRAVNYLGALLCCGWAGSLFQREGNSCFSISLVSEWSTVCLSVMNAKWGGKKCKSSVADRIFLAWCSCWLVPQMDYEKKNDWDGGQLQNLIPEMLLDGESELMVEPVSDLSKVGIQILLYEGIRRYIRLLV